MSEKDTVDPMRSAPRVCRLYRFWVSAEASRTEVDQEWDGWWSGRNWHALYDAGVWDPEFVVRWEPALVAVADEEHAALVARAEAAEAERDQLRQTVTRLNRRAQVAEAAIHELTHATGQGKARAVAAEMWERCQSAHEPGCARAQVAEAKVKAAYALADEWAAGRHLLLEWNVPIAETAATALLAALADAPAEDEDFGEGCDCTELCEMGPTCPGGAMAGLPGSGCHRVQPDCPHAAPMRYCNGCKVTPCPIGLDRAQP